MRVSVHKSRGAAFLTIGDAVRIAFTGEDLADLLPKLAQARETIGPAPPDELDDLSALDGVTEPRWEMLMDTATGRRALAFRHPGFGWLAFELTDEVRRTIGAALRD